MSVAYRVVHKEVGETPLQALERVRASESLPADLPMTYAGRLDPMAEGKLLILVGDECKRKDAYTRLDKEYEYDVLLGIESDTGDVLGIPKRGTVVTPQGSTIRDAFESVVGTHHFPYPKFSSKNIAIDATDVKPKETRVYTNELLDVRSVSSHELLQSIVMKIGKLRTDASDTGLRNDFRRADILKAWPSLLEGDTTTYTIARGRAVVSSGTYIRTLAASIAASLGTVGLAASISRTRVGSYVPLGMLSFWVRSY